MALSTYTYEQLGFGTELGPLTDIEKNALEKSWATAFASDIFPYIDEKIFAPLYSERKSRRNVPVNVLAGAILLQEIRGMSNEDLVEAAMFDLRLRTALHITNAVGQPISLRTIQRFHTRLRRYRESSGEDLLGICFDRINDRMEPFLQKYAKYMVKAARIAEVNRNRRMAGAGEQAGMTGVGEYAGTAATGEYAGMAESGIRPGFRQIHIFSSPQAYVCDLQICLNQGDEGTGGTLEIETQIRLPEGYGAAGISGRDRLRLYYDLKKGEDTVFEGSADIAADAPDTETDPVPVKISMNPLNGSLWQAEELKDCDLTLRLSAEQSGK
ncbi:MAG: transposase [Eubacteriales bacterium]|nr:transposase [Eubacteriales bacterium]